MLTMFNRLIRWLARDIIFKEKAASFDEGQIVSEEKRQDEIRIAYLNGITDGVAIAVQSPGTPPAMMSKPKDVTIRTLELWDAIDRADIVRRGIEAIPGDRSIDIEGINLRADQMRALLKKNNQ